MEEDAFELFLKNVSLEKYNPNRQFVSLESAIKIVKETLNEMDNSELESAIIVNNTRYFNEMKKKLIDNCIRESLAYIKQENLEKSILLFLHLKESGLYEEIAHILDSLYIRQYYQFLPWDISNVNLNFHLKRISKAYLDIATVENLINSQVSSCIILSMRNDQFFVHRLIIHARDFCREFSSLAMDSNATTFEKKVLDCFGHRCNVMIEKSLEDGKTSALKEKVPLLLYLYRDENLNHDTFFYLLATEETNEIFNFKIFVYNVTNSKSVEQFYKNSGLNFGNQLDLLEYQKNSVHIFYTATGTLELSSSFSTNIDIEGVVMKLIEANSEHEELVKQQSVMMEKLMVASAINNIDSSIVNEYFWNSTLESALNETLFCNLNADRKMLVLYYHNRSSQFWKIFQQFMSNLNDELKYQIKNLCQVLPWDITIPGAQQVMKDNISEYFKNNDVTLLNNHQENVLFFIDFKDKYPMVSYVCSKDANVGDLIDRFRDYFLAFANSIESTVINEYVANQTNSINKIDKPLQRIIKEHCLCEPVTTRKILLLHLYTNKDDKVLKSLESDASFRKLVEKFYLVSWDMSDDRINNSLLLSIENNLGITSSDIVMRNCNGLYLFMPIAQSLTLALCAQVQLIFQLKLKLEECYKFFEHDLIIEDQLSKLQIRDGNNGPTYFQQNMYESIGNRDFDCFKLNEGEWTHLKEKIGYAYFGPPESVELYNEKQQKKINATYDKIIETSRSNDFLYLNCIFNCFTPLPSEKVSKLKKESAYNPNLDITQFPIFVLRKCAGRSTSSPCRIFIDHDLRVYENWEKYLEQNKLPKGILIVPLNGKYESDGYGNVKMQYVIAPSCGMGSKLLKVMDIGATLTSIGAGGIGLAALVPAITVAPFVAVGATVAGVAIGTYSMGRSISKIIDRKIHGESMSVANSEARSAYFNLLAGTLGFTGSGASLALSKFAQKGYNIGLLARRTVIGVKAVNVFVSGAAVVNSTVDMVGRWAETKQAPDPLTILQLSSSILFFGHAVYNVKSANTIITEAQMNALQDIQSDLRSNRHRKTFDKLTKETIKINGDVQTGRSEVISFIKNINNQDEILAALTRANKQLNKEGIKFAIQKNNIIFNGEQVNINEFSNLSKMQRSKYLDNFPKNYQQTVPTVTEQNHFQSLMKQINIPNTQIIDSLKLITNIPRLSKIEIVEEIISRFCPFVQNKIIFLLKKLLKLIDLNVDLKKSLIASCPGGDYVVPILKLIIEFFKSEALRRVGDNKDIKKILNYLEKGIILSVLSPEGIIKELISEVHKLVVQKFADYYISETNEIEPVRSEVSSCPKCGGTPIIV